jgi:hypothetical protein
MGFMNGMRPRSIMFEGKLEANSQEIKIQASTSGYQMDRRLLPTSLYKRVRK